MLSEAVMKAKRSRGAVEASLHDAKAVLLVVAVQCESYSATEAPKRHSYQPRLK